MKRSTKKIIALRGLRVTTPVKMHTTILDLMAQIAANDGESEFRKAKSGEPI